LNKLKLLVVLFIIGTLVVGTVAAPPPIPGGGGAPSDPASGFGIVGAVELFGLYLLFLYMLFTKKQIR
jgi:hypothetical protein